MIEEVIRQWAPILFSAASLLLAISVQRRQAQLREMEGIGKRVADGESEVDELRERLGRLEVDMAHLPTKDQVHRLELRVEGIGGDTKAMNETLKAVAASSSRVENYMLQAERRTV